MYLCTVLEAGSVSSGGQQVWVSGLQTAAFLTVLSHVGEWARFWGFNTKSKNEQLKSDQAEESLNSKVERQVMEREKLFANHISNKGLMDSNRFSQRGEMAKYRKRWWTWLIISEVQIKTTMRCSLTACYGVYNPKTRDNKRWQDNTRCWWECKLVQPL